MLQAWPGETQHQLKHLVHKKYVPLGINAQEVRSLVLKTALNQHKIEERGEIAQHTHHNYPMANKKAIFTIEKEEMKSVNKNVLKYLGSKKRTLQYF